MKKLFTLALLSFITTPVFAKFYWPTFSYPEKELLLKLNYLNTTACPPGKAKLITTSAINLSLCHSEGSCPSNWEWIGKSDEKCHDLSEIDFLGNKISHVPDNIYWEYSVVTASYGSKKTGDVYFEYVMTTPLGEYWYCTEQRSGLLSCANDFEWKG